MTSFLTNEIVKHGYLAVFVLMILESACIPIPSEAVMTFGGALAGGLAAAAHPHVGWVGIALAGAAGNVVGALVAYAVGRAGGRPLLERWGRYILLRHAEIERAERFFDRHGTAAVLTGRVLPVVRTFISLPAGVAEMPVVRFTAYTALGSLPWTFALSYAGYALAANWQTVSHDFTPVSVAVAVLAVAAIVWWYLRARRVSATERAAAEPHADATGPGTR